MEFYVFKLVDNKLLPSMRVGEFVNFVGKNLYNSWVALRKSINRERSKNELTMQEIKNSFEFVESVKVVTISDLINRLEKIKKKYGNLSLMINESAVINISDYLSLDSANEFLKIDSEF